MQAVKQLKTMNMLLGKFHRMKQQFEKEQKYSSYWWCSLTSTRIKRVRHSRFD